MTVTALDMTVLEHLDVPIPCTIPRWPDAVECGKPSTWILVVDRHTCQTGCVQTFTMCIKHYEDLIAGGLTGWCDVCRAVVAIKDLILRLEPLNSKGNQ